MNQNQSSEFTVLLKNESVWMFQSFTGEESQEVIDKYLRQAEDDVQQAINSYFNDKEKESFKKELKFCDPFLKSGSEERPLGALSKGNQSTQSSDKLLEWDLEVFSRDRPIRKLKRALVEEEKPLRNAVEKRNKNEEVIIQHEPEYPSSLKKRKLNSNPFQIFERENIYSNPPSPSPSPAQQIPLSKPKQPIERLELSEETKSTALEIPTPCKKNSIHDLQKNDLSVILRSLQPIAADYLIPFTKPENLVLLYKNSEIQIEVFVRHFRELAKILQTKLKDYRIQRVEDRHLLVLMKINVRKNSDFKLKSDYFDLPDLRPELFRVEDLEDLELKLSRMDGAQSSIAKQDMQSEKKQRDKMKKNKEFYALYRRHRSVEKLVEIGLIHPKEALHYKQVFEFLNKEREEREIRKRLKREEINEG